MKIEPDCILMKIENPKKMYILQEALLYMCAWIALVALKNSLYNVLIMKIFCVQTKMVNIGHPATTILICCSCFLLRVVF